MISKKTALSLIVIVLAFAIGYLTYQTIDIIKTLVVGQGAQCSGRQISGNCPDSREGYGPDLR